MSLHPSPPPRLAEAALRTVLSDGVVGRSIAGDLYEEYLQRLLTQGAAGARAWYRREAFSVISRGIFGRIRRRNSGRATHRTCRDGNNGGDGMLRQLIEELRYALRGLLRSPGFTLAAVLTLGLGIGANAAVFSVVNGVLIDPLPFKEPDRLVVIRSSAPGVNVPSAFPVSTEHGYFYRRDAEAVEDAGLYSGFGATLRIGDVAERLRMSEVTLSLFSTLGVSPLLGRLPTVEELAQDLDAVLISHTLWQQQFGADPDIVGKTVDAVDSQRIIVGVMGPDFTFPEDDTAIWFPFYIDPERLQPGRFRYELVARVKAGTGLQELLAQLRPIADRMPEVYSSAPRYVEFITQGRYQPVAHWLKDRLVGDLSQPLWLVLATVLVVWMIACANVANLFFVRAEARQREMAVRSALGAGRGRLIRVFAAEAIALAAGGGIVGGVLAWAAVPVLLAAAPPGTPRLNNVGLDPTVLGFAIGLTLASALFFGLVPALRYSSSAVLEHLRTAGRTMTTGRRRQWTRGALVVLQSGMAMVLLICSGLLLRSFQHLANVDPGYDPKDVLTFQIAPPREAFPTAISLAAFHRSLMERLGALPGVESVGAIRNLPIDEGVAGAFFNIEGHDTPSGADRGLVYYNYAAPGYFQSMGIEVLSGRGFLSRDNEDDLGQAVVSRSMAEKSWPGEDPIGKRLRFARDDSDGWETVVGVVEDVRDVGLREAPRPTVYLPFVSPGNKDGWSVRSPAYTIRARNAASLIPLVRQEIRSLDAVMPFYRVQVMEEVVQRSMVRLSFTLLALGISALMALVLGMIGLYGVLSYVVSQRTQEIGIRLALGARIAQVRRMVVLQGTRLALVGVAAGLLASLGVTRLLQDLLYDTQPLDPAIFSATAAVMLLVSLLACFIPARRACSVDPVESLRLE